MKKTTDIIKELMQKSGYTEVKMAYENDTADMAVPEKRISDEDKEFVIAECKKKSVKYRGAKVVKEGIKVFIEKRGHKDSILIESRETIFPFIVNNKKYKCFQDAIDAVQVPSMNDAKYESKMKEFSKKENLKESCELKYQFIKDLPKDEVKRRIDRGNEIIRIFESKKTIKEASIPSNVLEFAKRKGSYAVSLVKKAAMWAEKAGKRITNGTAIGKHYDTIILDMTYHGSEIYISLNNETIKLYDEEVTDAKSFKKVLDSKLK